MSNYRKYLKYLIPLVMVISLTGNLFFVIQLRALKNTVSTSNSVISTRVESGIRATMLSIKELKETGAKEDMVNLQRSIQQLVLTFNNWMDLNQEEKNPNEALMKGLSGLETLRNTIVHNLGNQYSSRNEQLTEYDIVLLDKIYGQLDRFLMVYSNVQGRVSEIKNPDNSDGGLSQWDSNNKEISRLYRHSRIPNEHPKYINLGSVLKSIYVMFPEINNLLESKGIVEKIKEAVKIQDGVHYYEVSYYVEDELAYLIWIDAIDSTLRKFEDYTTAGDYEFVSKDEALNIAKEFMDKFMHYEQVIHGESTITDENTQSMIYAFQFTPKLKDITIISDRVHINVSAQGGNILKYASNFNGTIIPAEEGATAIALEDIEEKYKEQLLNMEYAGISIVRSFYTHYRPIIAYSYQSNKKEEIRRLYFDVATGNQIYEAYSVYEPVSYINTDDLSYDLESKIQ